MQWEYRTQPCVGDEVTSEFLSESGRDGWELAAALSWPLTSAETVFLIFKRPLPGRSPFEEKVAQTQAKAERIQALQAPSS